MFKNLVVKRIVISMLVGLVIGFLLSELTFYFLGETARKPTTITVVVPALTVRDAWQLAANSFEASFADDAHKARWRAALDQAFVAAAAAA